jgi:hypothetical protein
LTIGLLGLSDHPDLFFEHTTIGKADRWINGIKSVRAPHNLVGARNHDVIVIIAIILEKWRRMNAPINSLRW